MKIFIAGCGRSGTTLLRRLMTTFEETFVQPTEEHFSKFGEIAGQAPNLIVKRRSNSYKSLHRLPSDIDLIYCVRHPFDVLTSPHRHSLAKRPYHITTHRWRGEYRALSRMRSYRPERHIVLIRYEDVITKPDTVQMEISAALGLKPRLPFSKAENIFTTSLRKWESDPIRARHIANFWLHDRVLITRFCREFSYDVPDSYILRPYKSLSRFKV